MVSQPALIVHQLPRAQKLIGRERLSNQLRDFWQNGRGVASLVGIGGAGKTSLLQEVMDGQLEGQSFDGVLVWSFYDDPDTNAFLRTAVEYCSGTAAVAAQGTAWFHALKQALDSDKKYLLILDGLERVQRPMTDARGVFGELEDPLLRGLLVRLASSSGASQAIITSRFPIADLEPLNGNGHIVLDVDQLDPVAAMQLVMSHQVSGSRETVQALCNRCGGHALTLDLLGAAIERFFDGDAERVPPAPLETSGHQGELQTTRLSSVLRLFNDNLSPRELHVMSRLCVFRFGVSIETLKSVLIADGSEISNSIAENQELDAVVQGLVRLRLIHVEGPDRFTVHPAIRDHFYGIFREVALVHGAIQSHLSTLTNRPGVGLPTSKEALDLLEELVHHAVKSGHEDHALDIYAYRMGGGDHLNITLGEYGRTLRILKTFKHIPDAGAMYYCMRAFGRFEEALNWRPRNSYIRILCGDLTSLRDVPDESTRRIARLLQGERLVVPERAPDHPLCPAHLLLLMNKTDEAELAAKRELDISMHQDDIVRNHLCLAEVCRKKGRLQESKAEVEKVATWILRSGSHEHLATMFLFRARREFDEKLLNEGRVTLEEAIQICADSGFVILEIEARCDWARFGLLSSRVPEALDQANLAIELASRPQTAFVWGEMRALQMKRECLIALGNQSELVPVLRRLADLQRLVDSPEWRLTDAEMRQIEGSVQ